MLSAKGNPCHYKSIRKSVGMTAQEVATKIGVSISTVFSCVNLDCLLVGVWQDLSRQYQRHTASETLRLYC